MAGTAADFELYSYSLFRPKANLKLKRCFGCPERIRATPNAGLTNNVVQPHVGKCDRVFIYSFVKPAAPSFSDCASNLKNIRVIGIKPYVYGNFQLLQAMVHE
jgi:hypothetical protein